MEGTRQKIRIAVDTTYMDRRPGKGTAIVIRNSVQELLKRSDEFDVTLIHRESIPEDPIYGRCKEIIIPKIRLPKFSGFFSELAFFLTSKERFDIYYFSYSRLYPTFWLAPARKIVWAAMDGGPRTARYEGKADNKVPWLSRLFFRRVSSFIAISEFGKAGIIETYGVPAERVPVVYDGVDERYSADDEPESARARLSAKYGIRSPYILDVSRFDPHKNILRLLDAYAELVRDDAVPHTLVFVGGRHMPDYSQQVEEHISALGLSERVIIAPFIENEDMPSVYRCADLMVFPSLYEGFGLPVIESMACGTPVVISDIEALVEVAGGSAEVVDPYDARSIAAGMRRIMTDASYRSGLLRMARSRAAYFTWGAHGEALAAVMRDVCGRDGV